MNAPEKIVDRSQFLGGSDAAGVLGVSDYQTPLEVYLWKIGEPTQDMLDKLNDPETQRRFRRGKREEPHVINDLAEDYGVKIVKRSAPEAPNRYVDPEYPFLAAEIDFEFEVTPELVALVAARHPEIAAAVRNLVGTVQNGEVKTHHVFMQDFFGLDGSDEVPITYTAQATHGLMVTGRQLCMFGVRATMDDLRVYWILRDEENISVMRPRLVSFWRNNVLARVPPEVKNLPDVERLLRRTPAKTIEATPEVSELIAKMEELRAEERSAHEGVEDMKFQIGKAVLGAESLNRPVGPRGGLGSIQPTSAAPVDPHVVMVGGEPRLQISFLVRTGIDSEKVRTEYPEVAAACASASPYLKFGRPPKPKTARRKRA